MVKGSSTVILVDNRMNQLRVLFTCLLVPLFCNAAGADEQRTISLSVRSDFPFSPVRAYFLLSADSSYQSAQSALIFAGNGNATPLISLRTQIPSTAAKINYIVVGEGPEGQVAQTPVTSCATENLWLGIDQLREGLEERRRVLRSWEAQIQAQQDTIERLQKDADAIGNVGGILATENQLAVVSDDIVRITMASEILGQRLNLLKREGVPRGFQYREAELNKQLADLVGATREAESKHGERQTELDTQLQSKMQMIEDTRYEHVDLLEQQLADLERHRKQLEGLIPGRSQKN